MGSATVSVTWSVFLAGAWCSVFLAQTVSLLRNSEETWFSAAVKCAAPWMESRQARHQSLLPHQLAPRCWWEARHLLTLLFPNSSFFLNLKINVFFLTSYMGRSPRGGMATHSSILAWRISWAEEPGGPQSTGPQRIGLDWVTEHTRWVLASQRHCEDQMRWRVGKHLTRHSV